jgi:acyl-coenzyme A thioesterase PaaI-like protein
MSRLRPIFRAPPFKPYCRSCAPSRHTTISHLELPLQSCFRWSYLWYGGILALGITTGLGARQFAAPLGLPTPGSLEDKLIVESLGQDIDRLDIVQSLRKQSFNLHSDTLITGAGSSDNSKVKGWVEVDVDPAKDQEDESRTGILGALSGTRGFGVQRAFWNAETREMVAVVWIGGGLAGWPGVAHGGAIATIFEETMARMVRGPSGAIGAYTIQKLSRVARCMEQTFRIVCEANKSDP